LSDKSISAPARGKLLHDFYLKGLPSYHVGPVVDIAHYTFGTGQIRTNQFFEELFYLDLARVQSCRWIGWQAADRSRYG